MEPKKTIMTYLFSSKKKAVAEVAEFEGITVSAYMNALIDADLKKRAKK